MVTINASNFARILAVFSCLISARLANATEYREALYGHPARCEASLLDNAGLSPGSQNADMLGEINRVRKAAVQEYSEYPESRSDMVRISMDLLLDRWNHHIRSSFGSWENSWRSNARQVLDEAKMKLLREEGGRTSASGETAEQLANELADALLALRDQSLINSLNDQSKALERIRETVFKIQRQFQILQFPSHWTRFRNFITGDRSKANLAPIVAQLEHRGVFLRGDWWEAYMKHSMTALVSVTKSGLETELRRANGEIDQAIDKMNQKIAKYLEMVDWPHATPGERIWREEIIGRRDALVSLKGRLPDAGETDALKRLAEFKVNFFSAIGQIFKGDIPPLSRLTPPDWGALVREAERIDFREVSRGE